MSSLAADIAAKLGRTHPEGHNHLTECPLCCGRLSLRDGETGKLLVTCWGGCDNLDILDELKKLGMFSGAPMAPETEEARQQRQAAHQAKLKRDLERSQIIWSKGVEIKDTLADTYLRTRGLDLYSPFVKDLACKNLRFHNQCEYKPGTYLPALIAKIEHHTRGFIGVSRTYLSLDGLSKTSLDPPRLFLGEVKTGAVQLGIPSPDKWLVIAEGIETTLSVMEATELPGWVSLSANGLRGLELPSDVKRIIICADNDQNKVGQTAANETATKLVRKGYRVKIAMPAIPAGCNLKKYDFNDLLMDRK